MQHFRFHHPFFKLSILFVLSFLFSNSLYAQSAIDRQCGFGEVAANLTIDPATRTVDYVRANKFLKDCQQLLGETYARSTEKTETKLAVVDTYDVEAQLAALLKGEFTVGTSGHSKDKNILYVARKFGIKVKASCEKDQYYSDVSSYGPSSYPGIPADVRSDVKTFVSLCRSSEKLAKIEPHEVTWNNVNIVSTGNEVMDKAWNKCMGVNGEKKNVLSCALPCVKHDNEGARKRACNQYTGELDSTAEEREQFAIAKRCVEAGMVPTDSNCKQVCTFSGISCTDLDLTDLASGQKLTPTNPTQDDSEIVGGSEPNDGENGDGGDNWADGGGGGGYPTDPTNDTTGDQDTDLNKMSKDIANKIWGQGNGSQFQAASINGKVQTPNVQSGSNIGVPDPSAQGSMASGGQLSPGSMNGWVPTPTNQLGPAPGVRKNKPKNSGGGGGGGAGAGGMAGGGSMGSGRGGGQNANNGGRRRGGYRRSSLSEIAENLGGNSFYGAEGANTGNSRAAAATVVDRRVAKKIAENKKANLDPNAVNAAFQRGLRRGENQGANYLPSSFFPHHESARDYIIKNGGTLDEKGRSY